MLRPPPLNVSRKSFSEIYARAASILASIRPEQLPSRFLIITKHVLSLLWEMLRDWLGINGFPSLPILSNRLPNELPIDGCYLHYHTSCLSSQSIRYERSGNLLGRAVAWRSRFSNFLGSFSRVTAPKRRVPRKFPQLKGVKALNTCSNESQVYPLLEILGISRWTLLQPESHCQKALSSLLHPSVLKLQRESVFFVAVAFRECLVVLLRECWGKRYIFHSVFSSPKSSPRK